MKKHAHPNVKVYLAVFGALAVLTMVTVGVSYLDLPVTAAILLALLIATFKAGLVAAFFMHLKGERALIYGILGVAFFFVGILFVWPIADVAGTAGVRVHAERARVAAEH